MKFEDQWFLEGI